VRDVRRKLYELLADCAELHPARRLLCVFPELQSLDVSQWLL
jgi:hypothetical protein